MCDMCVCVCGSEKRLLSLSLYLTYTEFGTNCAMVVFVSLRLWHQYDGQVLFFFLL